MNGVCNTAQLYGGLLHGRCYKIAYGGSKSGVGACLYNQQQNNRKRMLKIVLAFGSNLVNCNFA